MIFSTTLVIVCIIGAGIGQVLLKIGISQVDSIKSFHDFFQSQTLFKIVTNPYVITALICYGILAILWLGAMSSFNISFLFPLLGLAYLVTALVAWLFLKETINTMHWVGIGLIICGSVFIALSKV